MVGYTHYTSSYLDGLFWLEAGCSSRDAHIYQPTAERYGLVPVFTHANWCVLLAAEVGGIDAVVVLMPTPIHVQII